MYSVFEIYISIYLTYGYRYTTLIHNMPNMQMTVSSAKLVVFSSLKYFNLIYFSCLITGTEVPNQC